VLVTDEFGENWDIYLYSAEDPSPRSIIASQHIEWGARLSPDGKWLAYASDETGESEVYVQDFPALAGR
jgi:Tol biopolymer transport system component